MTQGKPTVAWISCACGSECATAARGHSSPISRMALRNSSRSSAMSMASRDAAINSTPCLASTPSRTRSSAVFSAVWPPMVGSSALGFSFSMMRASVRQLMGSM